MIKVMIVDDHLLIRKGIKLLLEGFTDIQIVGEANDGEQAITVAIKESPDVILMDLSMPNGLDGFTAAQEILNQVDHVKIILLTMYDEEIYVQKAIQTNVHGYILKNSQGGELYEAIQSVYNGKRFFRVGLPEEHIDKLFQNSERPPSILTMREKEIVRLTILGYTNIQIGKKLSISPKTVENHKSKIMQKLKLKSKHELIQYGLNNHYIDL